MAVVLKLLMVAMRLLLLPAVVVVMGVMIMDMLVPFLSSVEARWRWLLLSLLDPSSSSSSSSRS